MDNNLLITNIQRMCFHDGPGLRTTVFLKGCNLHCPWCSNPENLNFEMEEYETKEEHGMYGCLYTSEKLVDELIKDMPFWGDDGGVTFSGGEALMQSEALIEVLELLKEKGVHIAIETALFISTVVLEQIIPFIDYFIVDVKIMNPDICKDVLGGNLSVYQNNIELLYRLKKLKLLRVPCCKEYTLTDENKRLLCLFLKKYRDVPVEIFKIHELGESKYKSLSLQMWRGAKVTDKDLIQFSNELIRNGICAEIIQI